MSRIILKFTLLTLLVIAFFTASQAQQQGIFSKKNIANQYATVGIGGGSSHYFGDLSPYSSPYYAMYKNVRWNGTLNYTRQLTNKFGARLGFSYIRLFGDDATYAKLDITKFGARYMRNFNFRNDMQEFSLMGIYNLGVQNGKGTRGRNKTTPYIAAGIAMFAHNPKAYLYDQTTSTGSWIALKPLGTSGQNLAGSTVKPYGYVQAAVPIAVGVRYRINEKMDIGAEGSFRLALTDYIDDVGDAPYATGLTDPLAVKLAYRANEDFESYKYTVNRIPKYIQINQSDPTWVDGDSPSLTASKYFDSSTRPRGYDKKDSYILIQFTLNYLISGSGIKCPPIK